MSLGVAQPKNSKWINGTLNPTYIINGNDDIINVDTTSGTVTIYLPNIKNSGMDSTPKPFYINDVGGNAGTNNIIISTVGGDLINGGTNTIISTNNAVVECTVQSQTEWLGHDSSGGGGGSATTYTEGIVATVGGQGGAKPVSSNYNYIDTCPAGGGIICPVTTSKYNMFIQNAGANSLNVYPPVGGSFKGKGVNVALSVDVGAVLYVQCATIGNPLRYD